MFPNIIIVVLSSIEHSGGGGGGKSQLNYGSIFKARDEQKGVAITCLCIAIIVFLAGFLSNY